METAGLATGVVGLAGLFSVCLDVIEAVDDYRDFTVDSQAITAQFDADKHRFQTWGQGVGYENGKLLQSHSRSLEDPAVALIVEKILVSIRQIFVATETTELYLKPGIRGSSISTKSKPANAGSKQNSQTRSSRKTRIGWSLRRKRRFSAQVQQFAGLVQRLYDIVSPNAPAAQPLNPLNDSVDGMNLWHSNQKILLEIQKKIEDDTKKELNLWLGASWTNDLFDNFTRQRLDGTCDWILNRREFLDWVSPDFPSNSGKFLWVNGQAGYGKTHLCARVVRHIEQLGHPVAYYFLSSDSESRSDPFLVVRSWIAQVAHQDPRAFEIAAMKWEEMDSQKATRTDILEILTAIVLQVPYCSFIVDGLDECIWVEESSRTSESIADFFTALGQAASQASARIGIFSRDDLRIRDGYDNALGETKQLTRIELKISPNDVYPDAMVFSRSIINKKLSNKDESLKQELSRKMVDRCDGMFLWMKMVEGDLRGGMNRRRLDETINQTPTAMEHLYDRNWSRILTLSPSSRNRALLILRWAAFALRPLTVLEVTEALLVPDSESNDGFLDDELPDAIDDEYVKSEIIGICESLIETRILGPLQETGSMTVHLAHHSVKQYILYRIQATNDPLSANEYLQQYNEAEVNNFLAMQCLRYLNHNIVWQEPLMLSSSGAIERQFREYAASSWYRHAVADGSNYKEVARTVNLIFDPSNENWPSFGKRLEMEFPQPEEPTVQGDWPGSPLFFASRLGFEDTVISLLEEKMVDINATDGLKRTAIQAASESGRLHIVKELLARGADVGTADANGRAPLIMASSKGHVEICQLLLQHNAEITAAANDGFTALIGAARYGHIEVVELLLNNGADINIPDKYGWTATQLATKNGHIEVVKLLLKNGADINDSKGRNKWTLLQSAADYGQPEVVRLFLENGLDVSAASDEGWTSLNLAAARGHVEVVRLLLEEGADMAAASKEGYTPLRAASHNNHIEVVRLLLEKGADINSSSNDGSTSLHSAALNGDLEIARLLLEKGANVTLVTNDGLTPMSIAALEGQIEIVRLLLEKDADTNTASNVGSTPLKLAAVNGHLEIARLLLENGAAVDIAGDDGWTPSHLAAYNGHLKVVELLLENGSDITAANGAGWTTFHMAASNGRLEIVKLLLEKGADIRTMSNYGWTPLGSAAWGGYVETVRFLLENGADVAAASDDGWTPLKTAANCGYVEIARLLLEGGADVAAASNGKWEPLLSAASSGHFEMVKLLVEKGADIATSSNEGWTPLHAAAQKGHVDIVEFLVDQLGVAERATALGGQKPLPTIELERLSLSGTKLAGLDLIRRSPLSYAVMGGVFSIVKKLMDYRPEFASIADYYGSTPLSTAARHGHTEIVELLLGVGDNKTDSRDIFGRGPLWWATKQGHSDVAELLRKAGYSATELPGEVSSPELPVETPDSKLESFCDVCTLRVQHSGDYYVCGACWGGNFCICMDCYEAGGRCLDSSHTDTLTLKHAAGAKVD